MNRWPWLVLSLALALGAACSSADEATSADPTTTVATGRTTSTTASAPVDGRPRIVLGGDSVMGNLAPAVIAALGDQADAPEQE